MAGLYYWYVYFVKKLLLAALEAPVSPPPHQHLQLLIVLILAILIVVQWGILKNLRVFVNKNLFELGSTKVEMVRSAIDRSLGRDFYRERWKQSKEIIVGCNLKASLVYDFPWVSIL